MIITNLLANIVALSVSGAIPAEGPAFQEYARRAMLTNAQAAACHWRLDTNLIVADKVTFFEAIPFPEGPTVSIIFDGRYVFRTDQGSSSHFVDRSSAPGWMPDSTAMATNGAAPKWKAGSTQRWVGTKSRLTLGRARRIAESAIRAAGVSADGLGFRKPDRAEQLVWEEGSTKHRLPFYEFEWRRETNLCTVGVSGVSGEMSFFLYEGPRLALRWPTNYMELLGLPTNTVLVKSKWLAYKYVVGTVMLLEANRCAERLKLPVHLPITRDGVKSVYISSPGMPFGGSLWTKQFVFAFNGHLRAVDKLHPYGEMSMAEANRTLLQSPSLNTTNDAYLLATNWLAALGVDSRELEKTNVAAVRQLVALFGDKEKLLPVFDVRWGEWDHANTNLEIDGRTSSLVRLALEARDISPRATRLIRDADQLLAIPDQQFSAYSPIERRDLVARFAADTYPETAKPASNPPDQHQQK
jgi:hypothetical protein